MRFWFRKKETTRFELPTSLGLVRMKISDGTIHVWDAEGEEWIDGWATVEDAAAFLVERVHIPRDEALSVAGRAVRQWLASREGRPTRYFRQSD